MQTVLKVTDLEIDLKGKKETKNIVERISFEIRKGETLALVGESGSGKSMTALSIMGLLQSWNSYLKPAIRGNIEFSAKDGKHYMLNEITDKQYDEIRGKDLSMIFQEPLTALNPVLPIGEQLGEVILAHENIKRSEARARALSLLKEVNIPDAENRLSSFPHQFSGGQLQRIMIAMAIACNTSCLIADEPTTALDVTVQDQILKLLERLQVEKEMAILLITHDLGIVSQFADRVAVMYSGRIVEQGRVDQIFCNPAHPYTKLLIESIPTLDTVPGEQLLTKKDFLSELGKSKGDLIFCPGNRAHYPMKKLNEEHYVSFAFTREV